MNIELTEREAQFLAEFAAKQYEGAEGNVGTRTPIHVVERIENTFVEDGSGEAWIDYDNDYETYESLEDLVAARRKNGETLPDYEDVEYDDVGDVWISDQEKYCEAYGIHAQSGRIIDTYRPVAFFLIRDEAVRYKDGYQAHNCGDCRIYTYGLGYSNNGDLPTFRNLLMRMGAALIEEQGGSAG